MENEKTIIYGGSFNMPHIGHMFVINYLLSKFDRVIVVPCYQHSFGKNLIDFEHRFKMCSFVVKEFRAFSEGKLHLSNIEQILGGESLTAKTVEFHKNTYPQWGDYYFALGEDAYKDLDKWKDLNKLLSIASPYIVESHLFPNIHSTYIRELLKNNQDIITARKYLHDEVYKFIIDNNLYL